MTIVQQPFSTLKIYSADIVNRQKLALAADQESFLVSGYLPPRDSISVNIIVIVFHGYR